MLKFSLFPSGLSELQPSQAPEKFSYAHSEFAIRNLFRRHKDLGLSGYDLAVFYYLALLSRRRVFIKLTTSELAEQIGLSQVKVSQSLKALKTLNLCKRIQYKEHKGFIIHPDIINNGDDKKRAFKFMLWDES